MLKLRVPLIHGETATSFCSRLALRNRCTSVMEFCQDVGLVFRDVRTGTKEALSALARLGGVDFEQLWSSTLRSHGPTHICRDNLIDGALRRTLDRLVVCPACIASDLSNWSYAGSAAPAGRTAWLLKPIMTCVEHNLALEPVNTLRPPSTWQYCDFARRIQEYAEQLGYRLANTTSRPASTLERYLCTRLNGTPPDVGPLFNTLPFYAVAHASLVLGAFDMFGPKVFLRRLTDDQRRECGAAGFDILAAGPEALRKCLHANLDRWPKGKNATSAAAHFGGLHAWLLYRRGDASYSFLREAIRELMVSNRAMRADTLIYGVAPGGKRLQSVRIASQEIRMHPKRLQRLLIAAGILDKEAAGLSAHKAAFPADAKADEVLQRVKRCIPKWAAAAYVNAPPLQFDLMHKAGLVVPFVKSGGEIKDYGFDIRDLDDFLSRLIGGISTALPDAPVLAQIPQAAKRANCSALTVIRMVLDRKLTRVYRQPDSDGLMAVLVDPMEVRTALKRPERPGLSIAEVEKQMQWSRPVVKSLIENGWLQSRVIVNPITNLRQTIVEPAGLEEFDRDFIALSSLAKKHQQIGPVIKAKLRSLGITPAFDPQGVRATFYRRAELPLLATATTPAGDNSW